MSKTILNWEFEHLNSIKSMLPAVQCELTMFSAQLNAHISPAATKGKLTLFFCSVITPFVAGFNWHLFIIANRINLHATHPPS